MSVANGPGKQRTTYMFCAPRTVLCRACCAPFVVSPMTLYMERCTLVIIHRGTRADKCATLGWRGSSLANNQLLSLAFVMPRPLQVDHPGIIRFELCVLAFRSDTSHCARSAPCGSCPRVLVNAGFYLPNRPTDWRRSLTACRSIWWFRPSTPFGKSGDIVPISRFVWKNINIHAGDSVGHDTYFAVVRRRRWYH